MHKNLEMTANEFFHRLGWKKQEGDVGLELEVEGENLPQSVSGWMLKPEGSLRSNIPGLPNNHPDTTRAIEYVTSGAVAYTSLYSVLGRLAIALNKHGVVVRNSHRCSTHVHVNFQAEKLRTFAGYCIIHTIIEPILLRIAGPDRNGNTFCLSSHEAGDNFTWSNGVANAIYRQNYDWYNRGKYSTMNTDSMRTFGTVETRCFPLSYKPADLSQWCRWLLNIRDIARDWDDPTYRSVFTVVRNNPMGFLSRVFTGLDHFHILTAPHNPETYVQAGLENAYEVYRGFRFLLLDDGKKKRPEKKPIKRSMFGQGLTTASWDIPNEVNIIHEEEEEF